MVLCKIATTDTGKGKADRLKAKDANDIELGREGALKES